MLDDQLVSIYLWLLTAISTSPYYIVGLSAKDGTNTCGGIVAICTEFSCRSGMC